MQQRLSTKEEYSKRINIVVEYINNQNECRFTLRTTDRGSPTDAGDVCAAYGRLSR